MSKDKDHYRFWNIRRYIALTAVIASGLSADNYNTSVIVLWVMFVVLPITALFFTSNDGDEIQVAIDTFKEWWPFND